MEEHRANNTAIKVRFFILSPWLIFLCNIYVCINAYYLLHTKIKSFEQRMQLNYINGDGQHIIHKI